MHVESFFDSVTNTVTYVVADLRSSRCAVIDPVLDYDPHSGRTATKSATRVLNYIRAAGLNVDWLLETHAHADHLSASPYLQQQLGGQIAIGAQIEAVQRIFGKIFNAGPDFAVDGSQFDKLFADGDSFVIGGLCARVIHTPGHTPACVTYAIADAAFVGDTLFMPDYGTARADFPGGDAATLYQSIRKVLALPVSTRLFMCHDYLPPGRDEYRWESTVAEQLEHNVHIGGGVTEQAFVEMRTARDQTLDAPRLLLPSVQVNMRAGHLPPAESNGVSYLKVPVDRI